MLDHVVDANNRLMSDGAFDYDYDEEGNRILKYDNGNDERIDYAWDHRNRLTTITFKDDLGVPVKIVHQVYDIFNRWIGQQIDADADDDIDSITTFVYDGDQISQEFDGAADTDLTHRYVWGATVDQLLADEHVSSLASAGSVVWPLTDHLGTIRDLAVYTNGPDTTAVENHIQYDSFGNIIDESDDGVTHRFGFTGRPFDAESALQNNLNRWYDPVAGQWMSQDPIGFVGRDDNLTRYVGNQPDWFIDPKGLETKGPLGDEFEVLRMPVVFINMTTRKDFAWHAAELAEGANEILDQCNIRLDTVGLMFPGKPKQAKPTKVIFDKRTGKFSGGGWSGITLKALMSQYAHAPSGEKDVAFIILVDDITPSNTTAGGVTYAPNSDEEAKWGARAIIVAVPTKPDFLGGSPTRTLAHECGHYLSLQHIDVDGNDGKHLMSYGQWTRDGKLIYRCRA
jgi:RHS repeat-associated protein